MCEPCNQLAGRCLEASVQPGEAQCCKPGAGGGWRLELKTIHRFQQSRRRPLLGLLLALSHLRHYKNTMLNTH